MKLTRRLRFVLLGVTGVILIAATAWTLRSDGGSDEEKVAGRLGPTPGPSSEGYIASKKAYLARIAKASPTQHAGGLVSLNSYLPAPKAQTFASSMEPSAVFLRFPNAEPESVLVETTIAGAVADRATDYAKELQAEIDAIEAQAAAATGAEKTDLAKSVAERKAALAAVKPDCVCVFAFAVTEAGLSELAEVAKRPEVRLVDVPDPVVNDFQGWQLLPLLPKKASV
jgi:hypothetical protein